MKAIDLAACMLMCAACLYFVAHVAAAIVHPRTPAVQCDR